jgi:hypothetical protein
MPFITEKLTVAKVECLETAPPGDVFYDFKTNVALLRPENFDAIVCKGCSFFGVCSKLSGLKTK